MTDLSTLAEGILATARRLIRTAVVGTVQAYDRAKLSAGVRPDVLERTVVDGVLTDIPTVTQPGVPVLHYGGQRFGFSYGVQEGDRVVLVYRSASHDEVDSDAAVPASPQAGRRHDLSDVVALPGYHPPATDAASARVRSDGQPVMFLDGSDRLHVGASTAAIDLARADRVDTQLEQIRDLLTGNGVPPWVPVPNDGGAALLTAASTLFGAPSPSTATARVRVDS